MKSEYVEMAAYRLEKARATLSDARRFLENATTSSVVNRLYYALFYAVNALLITDGRSSAKHSGVRSLFNREYVKTGIVRKEYGRLYSVLYDARQEGDYADFIEFDRKEVQAWLEMAVMFIDPVGNLVESRIAGNRKEE